MLLNDVLIQKYIIYILYIFIYIYIKYIILQKERRIVTYLVIMKWAGTFQKKKKSWKERAQWSDLHEARAQRR